MDKVTMLGSDAAMVRCIITLPIASIKRRDVCLVRSGQVYRDGIASHISSYENPCRKPYPQTYDFTVGKRAILIHHL
jgi:hypothetical protein